MKRRLLNLLTALSLLLCVAAVALWVRSYWRADVLGYEGPESRDRWQWGGSASSARGLLAVERWRRQNARGGTRPSAGFAFSSWPVAAGGRGPNESLHGFSYAAEDLNAARPASDGRAAPAQRASRQRLTAPHWFIALIGGAPSVVRLWGHIRRRRVASKGQCPSCGYDLTGNVSGVCPECGKAKA